MDNFAQLPGNQPFWIPEQMVVPAPVDAAPFYLPNLIAAIVASVGVVVGSIGPWITFLALSRQRRRTIGLISDDRKCDRHKENQSSAHCLPRDGMGHRDLAYRALL